MRTFECYVLFLIVFFAGMTVIVTSDPGIGIPPALDGEGTARIDEARASNLMVEDSFVEARQSLLMEDPSFQQPPNSGIQSYISPETANNLQKAISLKELKIEAIPLDMSRSVVIDTPGIYVLTGDYVGSDFVALDIQSSDVFIFGNGHSIRGNEQSWSAGVRIYDYLSNITITNIVVSNWYYGIRIGEHTYNCTVSDSTILNNKCGIIGGNFYGLYQQQCQRIFILNNSIFENFCGVQISGTNNTIALNEMIGYNNLDYDRILETTDGIYLKGLNNSVISNKIIGNDYGIHSSSAEKYSIAGSKNLIIDNLFINKVNFDSENAYNNNFNSTELIPSTNIIGGSFIGGNYWALSNATGFSQTVPDDDNNGICDEPYTIDENNCDSFPLASGITTTLLTLTVPETAYCQKNFVLSGRLTNQDGFGIANALIIFNISWGSDWIVTLNPLTITDSEGYYNLSWRSRRAENMTASFPGSSTLKPSISPQNQVNIVSQDNPVHITLDAEPDIILHDEMFTGYGYVTSNGTGIDAGPLLPQYSSDNFTWTNLTLPGYLYSDSSGYFEWIGALNITPAQRFYLRIRYDGNYCYYASAMSNVKIITYADSPEFYTISPSELPFEINDTIVTTYGRNFILGGDWTKTSSTGNAITITATTDGISFDGNNYTLTGNDTGCAVIVETDNVVVSHIKAQGWHCGIQAFSVSNISLESNHLEQNNRGIDCNLVAESTIINNTANHNSDYGIGLIECQNVGVFTNRAIGNTAGDGIVAVNSSEINVEMSEVTGNGNNGISFENVYGGLIYDNQVSGNTYNGIALTGEHTNITIERNNASNILNGMGITVEGAGEYIDVRDNIVSNNPLGAGIIYFSVDHGTISNNTANNNDAGIALQGCHDIGVYTNRANDNTNGDGIWVSNSSQIGVETSEGTGNGNNGISFENVYGGLIYDNQVSGNTYNGIALTGEHTNITIERNNASNILNGMGITVEGAGEYIDVRDNIVSNNPLGAGIIYFSVDHGTISNNTANNNDAGIALQDCHDIGVYTSRANDNTNGDGIWVSNSSQIGVETSEVTGNGNNGISFENVYGGLIYGNQVTGNTYNGIALTGEHTNITIERNNASNILNGRGITVEGAGEYIDVRDNIVSNNPHGAGIIYFSVDHGTISNNTANNNDAGIALQGCHDIGVYTNRANDNTNGDGIWVSNSSQIGVETSEGTGNGNNGISFENVFGGLIYGNQVTGNTYNGIALTGEHTNITIERNNASGTLHGAGITIEGPGSFIDIRNNRVSNNAEGAGINCYHINTGSLINNTANHNQYGIGITGGSRGVVVEGNTITESSIGIYLAEGNDNIFYNNFLNNFVNSEISILNSNNSWSIEQSDGPNIIGGPYIGGNYWATPNSTGFSQINPDLNDDGFCDSMYELAPDNIDFLPLRSQGITVLDPNGGETFYLGAPLNMSWTYTGSPGTTVNIEVLKGAGTIATRPGIPIGSEGFGSFNVKIPASTPLGNDYRIRVTSASNFSYTDISDGPFTISGPTITVGVPNGGETFFLGNTLPMNWTYNGNPGTTVNIEVLKGAGTLATLTGIPIGSGGSGSYSVPIPASTPLGSDYQIRVSSTSYPTCTDTSDEPFTIGVDSSTSITVTTPNGGENWVQGSYQTIQWTYAGSPGTTVNIEVLRNSSTMAVIPGISIGSGGSGSFSLTVPYSTPVGADYRIRVTSASNPATDTSDGPFTISPAIHVSTPDGGENYKTGASLPMSWTYSGSPGSTVNIDVLKGAGTLATLTGIPIGSGGSGSYSVPIPASTPLGSDYKIRVTSTRYAACTDTSDNSFTISAPG